MTFFLFLQDAKIAPGFGFFFFLFLFFKGISGVNSGIIISGVREEVFFFFSFLIWEDNDYLTSLVIFLLLFITKSKAVAGLVFDLFFFLNLNLNVNLNVELNLNLKLRKAPLADIGILGISSTYLGVRIYM